MLLARVSGERVTLNQPELAPQLQKVAADTKGNYLDVSLDTLRAAAAE